MTKTKPAVMLARVALAWVVALVALAVAGWLAMNGRYLLGWLAAALAFGLAAVVAHGENEIEEGE